jgi:short-chain Z-isoprenyl diphosphate synthase
MASFSLPRRLYAWWMRRRLAPDARPRHVALIMDGNRRWAREQGWSDPREGHRHGARHLETVLGWCADLGIGNVTIWLASGDNLRQRDASEVGFLMHLAETTIADHLVAGRGWRVHVAGKLDMLPDSTARALKRAEESTRALVDAGELTLAIGYSGRQEFVDAVRSVLDEAATDGRTLAELAERVSPTEIARHLYTAELPYPDLVIRTSGEQRLSDFLLWQSVDAELFFVDAYWPAFRRIDLLRVVRDFAARRTRRSAGGGVRS